MSLLGQTVTELQPTVTEDQPPSASLPEPEPAPSAQQSDTAPKVEPQSTRFSLPAMSHASLNPPEVQRYVVEHIVKNDDSCMSFTSQRLRTFSGKTPRPHNETDYETWRSGVELLLQDPAVSDLQRSRKIFDSLLPPAADMVKHLKPDTLPCIYLQTLDSAYGTVQDGDELYAKFMDTFQDAGEKPSAYLQRLQVALNLAVKRGGVSGKDNDRHLLTQFCRGCWDNSLITDLQLKQKKVHPPTFSDLLLLLRTEEDREAAKALRMKQHLGTVKARATTHAQYAHTDSEEKSDIAALTSVTQKLAQQVADIQKQLAALTAVQSGSKQSTSNRWHGEGQRAGKQSKNPSSAPKPGYCYREFLGTDTDVATLALVVPDVSPDSPTPVLIGMNTLESLYCQYLNSDVPNFQPSAHGYRAVLKLLQIRHKQQEAGSDGVVRLASKVPVLVPAGHTTVVDGSLHASVSSPVELWRFAIPSEWKERIIQKLQEIPDVFSHSDLDFGHTDKIKHHIKLSDETPFKHRPRPIHPQDIEAVRQHLRDLLEAGVIRESESPFASPIVVVRKKNGDIRLCIDYRKLNLQTVKDAYALPNLEESFLL
ncbi:hypothetical protein WMY93_028968 [Mugilogobius chulae]|uniref:Paraneoplastic antigen Ma-like C-terminal domain-containing protein n=1 Tax=Mugilogobius chulae TaxID=88201 RepID=A0AAW0MTZ9_9GOBI